MSQGHEHAGGNPSDVESGAVASSGAREVTGPTSGPPVDVGDVIDGRYELTERLGAGGMGYVFGGTDRRLQRPVAIKVIRAELAENRSMARRFEREALASSRLQSPYVVVVHDFGTTEGGVPYLVMERLSGEPLSRALRQDGSMSVDEAVRVGIDVVRALVAAHGKGIVHRDLKPDNVFVTDDGHTKVLDFGIAKILQPEGGLASPSLTSTGMMLGTPLYMSPESVRKKSEVGPPSDMYSVGSILFRMLTGRPVFVHEEPVVVLSMHVQRTPPKISDVRRDVDFPPELEALVDALLAKDPAARPTASETLEQLEAVGRSLLRARGATGPTPLPVREPLHEVATAVLELPAASPEPGAAGIAPPTDVFASTPEPTTATPPPQMDMDFEDSTEVSGRAAPPHAAPSAIHAAETARHPASAADTTPNPPVTGAPSAAAPPADPFAAPPPVARSDRAPAARPPLFAVLAGVAGVLALIGGAGLVFAIAGMGDDDAGLRATELPRPNASAAAEPEVTEPAPATGGSAPEDEADAPSAEETPTTTAGATRDDVAETPEDPPPAPAAATPEPRTTSSTPERPSARSEAPGRLRIDADVEATVRVDGRTVGTAPGEVELPAGRHRVVVEAPSGRRTLEVTIEPGATVRRRVSLAPRAPAPTAADDPAGLPELPSTW